GAADVGDGPVGAPRSCPHMDGRPPAHLAPRQVPRHVCSHSHERSPPMSVEASSHVHALAAVAIGLTTSFRTNRGFSGLFSPAPGQYHLGLDQAVSDNESVVLITPRQTAMGKFVTANYERPSVDVVRVLLEDEDGNPAPAEFDIAILRIN